MPTPADKESQHTSFLLIAVVRLGATRQWPLGKPLLSQISAQMVRRLFVGLLLRTEYCFTIVRTEWPSLSATGGVAGVERRAALRVDIGYEHMG